MSISGSCFLLLVCLFLVSRCSFVFVFLLVVLFCLNHNLDLFLLCILFIVVCVFCFCCFGVLFFVECWLPIQKTSLKKREIPKTPKMKSAEKENGRFDKNS